MTPVDQESVDPRLREFTAHVRGYAILTLDADGFVRTWNEGARLVKGYADHEIIGQPYERFFSADDVARGRPAEVLATARRDGQFEEEGWRVRKDGSRFWAHIMLTAIKDEQGELVGFGKITEDRTEAMQAERTLREHVEELARSNAELERYAYVASHDLSEPLRSIAGYADVLRLKHRAELSEEAQAHLDRIVTATVRMQTLIDDLLVYSRAGNQGVTPAIVNLEAVVAETLDLLAGSVAATEAEIEVDTPHRVTADRALLRQLLQNLISNALKFSEGRPHVEIGSAERPDGFEIWVADRGIGIDEEYIGQIFDLFRRLHPRQRFEGTGVGLAICRRIAHRLGGTLTAEAREGGGTVFRLMLEKGAVRG